MSESLESPLNKRLFSKNLYLKLERGLCPTKNEQDQTCPGRVRGPRGVVRLSEGTKGGCPRWVRGPWGLSV